MATIREILNGGDLWAEINALKLYPFIDSEMNLLFLMEYGNLPAFSGFEGESIENIAKLVVKLYSDKWDKVLAAPEIDVFSDSVKTFNENVDTTKQDTETNNSTNKVSGYNSATMVDDTGVEGNSTNNGTGNVNRTNTESMVNVKNAYDNLTISQKLGIVSIAMADIANYLKVYTN